MNKHDKTETMSNKLADIVWHYILAESQREIKQTMALCVRVCAKNISLCVFVRVHQSAFHTLSVVVSCVDSYRFRN